MTFAAIKATYILLEPTTPSSVPNGCLFLDSTNANVMTQKSATGDVGVIESSAASNPFVKSMVAGEAFAINKPLALLPTGKVVLADSDIPGRDVIIGHSIQSSGGDGAIINVLCIGANLAGVLTGLGFAPGDTIYMGESPGEYINDTALLTGNNDTIVKLGIADCATGIASASATDLILCTEYIAGV